MLSKPKIHNTPLMTKSFESEFEQRVQRYVLITGNYNTQYYSRDVTSICPILGQHM